MAHPRCGYQVPDLELAIGGIHLAKKSKLPNKILHKLLQPGQCGHNPLDQRRDREGWPPAPSSSAVKIHRLQAEVRGGHIQEYECSESSAHRTCRFGLGYEGWLWNASRGRKVRRWTFDHVHKTGVLAWAVENHGLEGKVPAPSRSRPLQCRWRQTSWDGQILERECFA